MKWTALLIALALAVGMTAVPATAQYQENGADYEWEPDEGLHEEEWYDPSDWWDGEAGVEYEYDYYTDDWYDYEYGYEDEWYDEEYGYQGDEYDTDWWEDNGQWEYEPLEGEYEYEEGWWE